MDDPNSLKTQIIRTNRYKGLLELRKNIRGLYGKYPFSIFVDLRGRIEEKINTFNNPMCDQATIKIVSADGSTRPLPSEECHTAVGNRMRLSEYIFNKYQDAEDFIIETDSVVGTYQRNGEDKDNKKDTSFKGDPGDPQIDVLQNRVEYLIRLMDHMSRTYGEAIPRIVNDVKEITNRLDDLYRRILKEDV